MCGFCSCTSATPKLCATPPPSRPRSRSQPALCAVWRGAGACMGAGRSAHPLSAPVEDGPQPDGHGLAAPARAALQASQQGSPRLHELAACSCVLLLLSLAYTGLLLCYCCESECSSNTPPMHARMQASPACELLPPAQRVGHAPAGGGGGACVGGCPPGPCQHSRGLRAFQVRCSCASCCCCGCCTGTQH